MDRQGLRERKKERTRQQISDVATRMFVAKGFDNVSVAEVAEAAEVSKMTVFNYFPRKEDLMLDRNPELIDLLTTAVTSRRDDESSLIAIRRLLIDLAERRHPVSGLRDGVQPFFRTVFDSSALCARRREHQEETESVLTQLLDDSGDYADRATAQLVAGFVCVAYRTAFDTTVRRLLAGEHANDIAADHIALLDRAFDAMDRAALATS